MVPVAVAVQVCFVPKDLFWPLGERAKEILVDTHGKQKSEEEQKQKSEEEQKQKSEEEQNSDYWVHHHAGTIAWRNQTPG